MWHARAKSEGGPIPGRVPPRLRARANATLLLSLILLLCLPPHAAGQQPMPRTIRVEVTNPLREPLQYRFLGREPQSETELEFMGNGRDWSFIQFDQLPQNVSLRVRGNLSAYRESEFLQAGRWYPFKTRLPLIVEISKPEALTPVEVAFWFGSAATEMGQNVLRTSDLKPEQVREFAGKNEIKHTGRQVLAFSWEASAISTAPPMPLPTAVPAEPTESSWWTYVTEEHPVFGIAVVLVVLTVLLALVLFGMPYLHLHRRRMSEKEDRERSRSFIWGTRPSPLDPLDYKLSEPASRVKKMPPQAEPVRPVVVLKAEGLEAAKEAPAKADSPRAKIESPGAKAASPSAKAEPTAAKTVAPRAWSDAPTSPSTKPEPPGWQPDLNQMKDEMRHLMTEMMYQSDKVYRAQKQAHEELERLKERSDEGAKQLTSQLELTTSLEIAISDVLEQLKDVEQRQAEFNHMLRARSEEVRKAADDGLGALRAEIDQLRAGLQELGDGDGRADALDSFYARTLGTILGQNVEALQEGNFEQLSGQVAERLNQFFRLEVPHGSVLQELCARAEAVNSALQEVAALMARLNPRAAAEAGPHLRRAAALAAELSGLQAQLQNRRATVETRLSIPVSLHPGARQTFLDELGRGIKREIDKLSEPQAHFDAELRRLVTDDVIAVADICDTDVAHPGAHPELEASLSRLFAHAGLLPVVPAQGESFKPGEQDLRRAVSDAAGKSLSVAQVINRGFYYEHRGERTLLRKAGVAVYR